MLIAGFEARIPGDSNISEGSAQGGATNMEQLKENNQPEVASVNTSARVTEHSEHLPAHEVFDSAWAARHNEEIWLTGPDGTYDWRNQSDGFFE